MAKAEAKALAMALAMARAMAKAMAKGLGHGHGQGHSKFIFRVWGLGSSASSLFVGSDHSQRSVTLVIPRSRGVG